MTDYALMAEEEAAQKANSIAPAVDDSYAAMATQEAEDRRSALSASLRQAVPVNPDQQAKVVNLASATGIPPDVVQRNESAIAEQARVRELLTLAQDSPILARQLTDPAFAKLAHADAENLGTVEQKITRNLVSFSKWLREDAKNVPGSLVADMAIGARNLNAGLWGAAIEAPAELTSQYLTAPIFGKYDPIGPLAQFAKKQRQGQEKISKEIADYWGTNEKGAYLSNMFHGALQSVWQSMSTAGIGALMQIGTKTAAAVPLAGNVISRALQVGQEMPMGALLPMMASQGGQSYGKARDQGVSPLVAAGYGVSDAMIEGLTEQIGLGRFVHDIKVGDPIWKVIRNQLATQNAGEQVATHMEDLNAWAILPENKDKTFGDYVADRPAAALDTLIQTTMATVMQTGIMGLASTHLHRDIQAENSARQAVALKELLAIAATDPTRTRSPTEFASFVQNVADQGDVKSLFIDGATFSQASQDKIDIAKLMPETAKQLAHAIEFKTEVEIPLGEFLSAIPGSGLEQTLMQDVRTIDGPTLKEASDEKWIADTKAQVEHILGQQEFDTAIKESAATVEQELGKQLTTANRFTKDVNTAYAKLASAFYTVQGARLGVTPEEMYVRYPLNISASGIAIGKVMDQAGIESDLLSPLGQSQMIGAETQLADYGDVKAYESDYVSSTSGRSIRYVKYDQAGNPIGVIQFRTLGKRTKKAVIQNIYTVEGSRRAGVASGLLRQAQQDFDIKHSKDLTKDGRAFKSADGVYYQVDQPQTFNQPVSTRVPTAIPRGKNPVVVENPLTDRLRIGLDTFAGMPDIFQKAVQLLTSYPNWQPNPQIRGAEARAEKFINDAVQNLLWLHDQVPADIRARSKLWYVGANVLANTFAQKYGISVAQASAVLAVNSPQTEWFTNVSRAERILDIWFGQQETAWSPEMQAAAADIGVLNTPRYANAMETITGKTLGDLKGEPILQAIWIRLYDQAHDNRAFRIVNPEGSFGDFVRNQDGTEAKMPWAAFEYTAKSIRALEDGSINTISQQLGGEHKVRSFYNNIFAPDDPHGDVTIDTHAVAAALLRPLSGSSIEVDHNLGGGVSNNLKGISGTYGIYAEAYRRAAAARGLLPREMQSITWEAIRGLYTDVFKNSEGAAMVEHAWQEYHNRDLSEDDVRSRVHEIAGGINTPAWVQPDGRVPATTWTSSYGGQLVSFQLPRRDSGSASSGAPAASGTGSAVPGESDSTPELTWEWEGGSSLFQPAYHGSPHDFTKFSTDAIGTGEGAQAYGWGLYFAENPGIAAGYHERLAGNPQMVELKLGSLHLNQRNQFDYSRRASENTRENIRASLAEDLMINEMDLRGATDTQAYVLSVLDAKIADYETEWPEGAVAGKELRRMLAAPGAVSAKWEKATGGVYQVDIPDEAVARMLDWDKSLNDQAPEVQAALDSMGITQPSPADQAAIEAAKEKFNQSKSKVDLDAFHRLLNEGRNIFGADIYHALEEKLGSESGTAGRYDKEASMALAAAGIPGIKYDDAGSRGDAKSKTKNIVVFDDSIITLTHKDGQPVTAKERADYFQSQRVNPDQEARGQITFNPKGLEHPTNLALLKNADLSTFLHELGHFQLEVIADIAGQQGAPAEIVADMDALLKWFGVQDLATWQAMTLDQKRPYHEQFARGFEAYLFEGKSPNIELNGIFGRFRAWLINVYKNLTSLNVTLSDEVRGVFDRMVATTQEIQNAEAARGYVALFESAQLAGATPEQWKAYQALGIEATQDAVDQLQARSLADMKWLEGAKDRVLRRLQKDAQEKRAEVGKEVAAEVNALPIYTVIRFLKYGEVPQEILHAPGVPPVGKLDLGALKEMYGDGPAAPWRYLTIGEKGVAAAEGVHPDLLAAVLGFKNGDDLVRQILAAAPVKEAIQEQTDQRMLERYGDLSTPQAIEIAANEAIHNQARARFIATELRFLANALNARAQTPAGGSINILAAAAKQFASDIIAKKKIREIRPSVYEAAEAKAGKASEAALKPKAKTKTEEARKEGDMVLAATEKRNQLVNHHAAAAAYDALGYVEKMARYLKKVPDSKSIDAGYREQIDHLLERFDLRKLSGKAMDRRTSLADWIKGQEEAGLDPVISEDLRNEAFRVPYQELTLEEFKGLVDAVKNIEHLGRLKNKLLTAHNQRELAAARAEIVEAIEANAKRKVQAIRKTDRGFLVKPAEKVRQFFAAHRKFASIANMFDGYKPGGVVWEYFVRGMNDAGAFEAVQNEKATVALSEMLNPIFDEGKLSQKVSITGISRPFTREERIGILLNLGNETNAERVMTDLKMTQDQMLELLGTVTPAEAKFVNEAWAYLDSFRPLIAAKERRITGVEPDWVKAIPFEITIAGGEKVKMTGGYYPIAYDTGLSSRSNADTAAAVEAQMKAGLYSRAQTARGHLKARVESTGRPLRYDFGDVITQHIQQVVHDLAWHEYLIDANRLLKPDTEVDHAIRENYGPELLKEMTEMMKDIAIGGMATEKYMDVLNHLRYGTTIVGLGFNIFNTIQNVTGLTQSMSHIGTKWVLKGAVHWAGDAVKFESSVRKMHEMSDTMRLRAKTQQREISEIRNKVTGNDSKLQAAYFLFQTKTQMIVDTPTWWGAYEKAMAEPDMTEEKAIALADSAVLDSQGGGQIKDLSGIQRGSAGWKAFTTFYSFFNTTFNLTANAYGRTNFKKPGDIALFTADVALLWTIPALLTTLLKEAFTGDWDKEKFLKKLLGDQLSFLMGTMVGVREASVAVQAATGLGQGFGYTGPAALRFFADLYQLGVQAYQGDLDEAFWKSLNNVGGVLFHYPAGQINRTLSGINALSDGRTDNPLAILMGPPHK